MHESDQVTLRQKVDFLLDPCSHPDRPGSVDIIETHFAWVFLADRFVYKLKKPFRFQHMDFTSLETRRQNCELEIALNRRLGEAVYIAVVPLSLVDSRMRLEGEGPVIEWLVKMHRLPAERMLDRAAQDGNVTTADLRRLLEKLATFYDGADRAPWTREEYVRQLERELDEYGSRLRTPGLRLEPARIERLVAAQRRIIVESSKALGERASGGWVVDAHGDLRPEHICLLDPPQIIDCLEFSRELRLLDSAADVSFLVLECQRMGMDGLGKEILKIYRECMEDPLPMHLFYLYFSRRALIRAHLSAWHLIDENSQGGERWLRRANWYLHAAQASIDNALGHG